MTDAQPTLTATAHELLMIAQGRQLACRLSTGEKVLVRLPTADELIAQQQAAQEVIGFGQPISRERAEEIVRPLPSGPEQHLATLLDILAPLMTDEDDNSITPVMAAPSCWEFIGCNEHAGDLYERLRAAYWAAQAALPRPALPAAMPGEPPR